jgi:hypothetical protein
LRILVASVVMLVLLASLAGALGERGSIGLDIIGSNANNTRIVTPSQGPINLEIIGSKAENIQIGCPEHRVEVSRCRGGCDPDCYVCSSPCGCDYSTPWDDFRRPLAYPWSSYIPTRYNRPFYSCADGCHGMQAGPLALGMGGQMEYV